MIYFKVVVNGVTVYENKTASIQVDSINSISQDIYYKIQNLTPAETYTVDLYVKAVYITGNTSLTNYIYFEVDKAVDYTLQDQTGGILSKLQGLKYVPPGAEGTAQGFVLNQTELYLNQTYNLSQGTVSFWLKWDGSTGINISDNIGIDSNGYIYVKNDAGTIYTLEGVKPPIGTYVPVYISWESGNGYIMINTTKITLNWAGNFVISKIGSISQTSGTIIDEFKVWDTYIPADQITYESITEQYSLIWNGKTISITPEGGQKLGMIEASFISQNMTVLNSTTLSSGQKTVIAPNETTLVILSRSGVSRRYYLSNYTKIAFPAEEATLVSSTISIRPTMWQYLTIKTADGRIATRIKLDNTQTATIIAVLGNDYIITLEDVNASKAMLYTITGDISLWVEKDSMRYSGKYIDASIDEKKKLLIVTYYDGTGETKNLNITIAAFDEKNILKYKIEDTAPASPIEFYKFSLPINNDTNVMYYKITVDADNQEYTKLVFGSAGSSTIFPNNIVPQGLVIFGAVAIGALMFIAINAYLMPLGALIALGAVKFLGFANVPPTLLGISGVFTALSLIIYRKDQGVG